MKSFEIVIVAAALAYCAWHIAAIVRLVARGREASARPARTLADCVEVRR